MVKFRRIPAFESSTRKDLVVEKKDIQISGHTIKNVPVQVEDTKSEEINYLISDPIFKRLYSLIRKNSENVVLDFDNLSSKQM